MRQQRVILDVMVKDMSSYDDYDPLLDAAENGYTTDGDIRYIIDQIPKDFLATKCTVGNIDDIKCPQIGEIVYDAKTQSLCFYVGTDWIRVDV